MIGVLVGVVLAVAVGVPYLLSHRPGAGMPTTSKPNPGSPAVAPVNVVPGRLLEAQVPGGGPEIQSIAGAVAGETVVAAGIQISREAPARGAST